MFISFPHFNGIIGFTWLEFIIGSDGYTDPARVVFYAFQILIAPGRTQFEGKQSYEF